VFFNNCIIIIVTSTISSTHVSLNCGAKFKKGLFFNCGGWGNLSHSVLREGGAKNMLLMIK